MKYLITLVLPTILLFIFGLNWWLVTPILIYLLSIILILEKRIEKYSDSSTAMFIEQQEKFKMELLKMQIKLGIETMHATNIEKDKAKNELKRLEK